MSFLNELAKRSAMKSAARVATEMPTQAESVKGALTAYKPTSTSILNSPAVKSLTPTPTPSTLESPSRRKFVKDAASLAINQSLPGGGLASRAVKAIAPPLDILTAPGEALVSNSGEILPSLTPALLKHLKDNLFDNSSYGENLDDMGTFKTSRKAFEHVMKNFYNPQHIPHLESALRKFEGLQEIPYMKKGRDMEYIGNQIKKLETRMAEDPWKGYARELESLRSIPQGHNYSSYDLEVLRGMDPQSYIDKSGLIEQARQIPPGQSAYIPEYEATASPYIFDAITEDRLAPALRGQFDEDDYFIDDLPEEAYGSFQKMMGEAQFTPEEIEALSEVAGSIPYAPEAIDSKKLKFKTAPNTTREDFFKWLDDQGPGDYNALEADD